MQTIKGPAWVRPTADYGPLAAFFIAYLLGGLYVATGALMAATVVAVALALIYERRVPPAPVVTAVIVMIFGGLTLWLQDETFIKMKPTIVYCIFAAILGYGLARGRSYLKYLMGTAMPLDDAGWMIFTKRWVGFFLCMALLNEAIWRSQPTETWVAFKTFGTLPLSFAFMAFQWPLLKRHMVEES